MPNVWSRGKRMKIVHIVGKLKKAGVEAVVFTYLRNMDLDGVSVDVLYDADSTVSPPADLAQKGIRFIEIPPYQKVFAYVSAIKKLCRENKYDIVHTHMNVLSVFSLYAAKRAGVPHRICHNHSTTSKYEKKKDLMKKVLRPTAKIFATDLAACSNLSARWMYGDKRVDSGLVTVFNNAIDLDRYCYAEDAAVETRKELGVENCFLIGHVGRFMDQKNHSFLIDIFAEVCKIKEDARLILIGDGENLDAIKEKIRLLGIEDKVVFKGIVPDVERYYCAMDVFLLPSLYEGLPVVALEAQATGLPCVISDSVTSECAVIPEVVFLPVNKEPEKWAKAVVNSKVNDRGGCNRIFRGGKFNIDNSAYQMREYYNKLMAE